MKTLKHSIEQLSSPICEVCNVEMGWSRSALNTEEQAIVHVFICPRCHGIAATKRL
jgi:hypothetical protein